MGLKSNLPLSIGFIGAGRMGGAIISGIKKGNADLSIWAAVRTEKSRQVVESTYEIPVFVEYPSCLKQTDILFIATEPAQVKDVCESLAKSDLKKDAIVVSIAAGVSTDALNEFLGGSFSIVRVMPNLACQYSQGVFLVSRGPGSTQQAVNTIESVLGTLGFCTEIDENCMNIGTAISASGPAFIFLFIEFMLKAAVSSGLPAKDSLEIILQTFKGAIEVLEQSVFSP